MDHQPSSINPRDLLAALHRGGRYHYLWRRLPTRRTLWRPVEQDLPDTAGMDDVYFGVHPTSAIPATDANGKPAKPEHVRGRLEIVAAVNCLFAEFDGKDFCPEHPLGDGLAQARAHIEGLNLPPSALVCSGGGYHAYWLLREPWLLDTDEEREAARALQAAWVGQVGGDGGAKDLARVLRVPGTVNTKYNPEATVTLARWRPDVVYARAEFEARLVPAEEEPRPVSLILPPAPAGGNGHAHEQLRERLLTDALTRAASYGGDNTGLWLACQLRDNQVPEPDARALLAEYGRRATTNPDWPFGERDEDRWWRSARSHPAREPWAPPGHQFEDWPEFDCIGPDGEIITASKADVDLCAQPCTDLGNAERLLALYGDNLRYVPPWRSWMVWNGTVWAKDSETARGSEYGGAYRMAAQMVRQTRTQMDGHAVDEGLRKAWRAHIKSSESHVKLQSCLNVASRYSAIGFEEMDAHPHLLPASNGTIDLRTGALRPHRRDDYITHLVNVPYDPDALCPTWDAFMESIFPQGGDLVAWVWRALGYILTGEVSERVVFFLWGSGRNGKSTLLEALADLLGEYAACIDSKVILVRRFDDGSSHEIAQLPGKRYVFTAETGAGRYLNEARLKSLSGADTIQACAKYEQPFSFRPQFKLMLATNHKPAISGTDHAIWDRIRLIPFEQRFYLNEMEREQFPKALPADRNLGKRLRAEFPGALARMVRSAAEWYRDGLGLEEHVVAATSSYREDSDVLAAWMSDCCEVEASLVQRSSELWASYSAWCDKSGEHKGTRKAFGLALRERGFDPFDQGRHDKAHWRGLRLLEQDGDAPDEFKAYEPGMYG